MNEPKNTPLVELAFKQLTTSLVLLDLVLKEAGFTRQPFGTLDVELDIISGSLRLPRELSSAPPSVSKPLEQEEP